MTLKTINTAIKTPHCVNLCGWPDGYLEFQEVGQNRVAMHLFGQDNGTVRIGAPILLDLEAEFVGFPTVAEIDWEARQRLGMGGFAVVYRVAPGVAAKVGQMGAIDPNEVEAQRYFARRFLALPVWDYQAGCHLPLAVNREVCPRHGVRREILRPGQSCACGRPLDVLLMPEADPTWVDTSSAEYRAFVMFFARDCQTQLGRAWDARPANVAYYQGRLVALDFGEERPYDCHR
jgi:hypothetical protein